MWSNIAQNNSVEEIENADIEEDINVIEVPRGYELKIKREIKRFIRDNYELLEEVYNKCFKDYRHISKEDFYIFAYYHE